MVSAYGFFLFQAAPAEAAQFGKYLITGSIEAESKREAEKTGDRDSSYQSFEHRYKVDVQSFVLSPRLLTYQLGLSVGKGDTDTNGMGSSIDNLGYNANMDLFSGRRVNGSLFTRKESTSSFTPMTSSAGSVLVSQTNTNYGAAVNLNYRAFPTTLNISEDNVTGSSGAQQIDRSTRRLQMNANNKFYGFSGNYAYAYTGVGDSVERANNTATHEATAGLERAFPKGKALRQDIRFSSSTRLGSFRDITSQTVTKTADYTLTNLDEIVRFDATLGDLTAQLPTAVGNAGLTFTIVKIDSTANRVTVRPAGTETINGANLLVIENQFAEATIVSNGINWETGSRIPKKRVGEDQSVLNLNSNTIFSYRPSDSFSNDSSLNLFYYEQQEGPGLNVQAANSTSYKINPRLTMGANLSANHADAGRTKSDGENASVSFNYAKEMAGWRIGLFENMGLNNSRQSLGEARTRKNVGGGASATRNFGLLNSNVAFNTSAVKAASSGGGESTNWQATAAWRAMPTERFQLQSSLRYSVEDTTSDAVIIATAAGGETTVQSFGNVAKTLGLDLGYSWLAFVSENKMANLNGGAIFNKQESQVSSGGQSRAERNFYYSQLLLRWAPLRALFFSMTLRGELDNASTETEDAKGANAATSQPRRAYVIESSLNYRIRKIFIELQHKWREETGTTNPYSRQSFYMKLTRPF